MAGKLCVDSQTFPASAGIFLSNGLTRARCRAPDGLFAFRSSPGRVRENARLRASMEFRSGFSLRAGYAGRLCLSHHTVIARDGTGLLLATDGAAVIAELTCLTDGDPDQPGLSTANLLITARAHRTYVGVI